MQQSCPSSQAFSCPHPPTTAARLAFHSSLHLHPFLPSFLYLKSFTQNTHYSSHASFGIYSSICPPHSPSLPPSSLSLSTAPHGFNTISYKAYSQTHTHTLTTVQHNNSTIQHTHEENGELRLWLTYSCHDDSVQAMNWFWGQGFRCNVAYNCTRQMSEW